MEKAVFFASELNCIADAGKLIALFVIHDASSSIPPAYLIQETISR